MESIENVIFYTLDKAIKSYRQYAQKQLKDAGFSVTIDQWLVLRNIQENPSINQQELSLKVFKDSASVTRIIQLLVQSNLLQRQVNGDDRRRNYLSVTPKGAKVLRDVQGIVLNNRATALEGISQEELQSMRRSLQKIIDNVKDQGS
ncbi:MarR family transcriptional regulator [Antarcticibacterium sp. 1MA-6-2]|uniref:MarR family winged helix-turn-helix transcriptional regulator n=1 Tax=Antarcticibacterium sp. 1MA-6-2 TaxID=2908210 RepID=UPI001F460E37|nr:MarR family transcriptional regulator [Antarcticibacterium sp. 1MA-6-2]UJH92349.1 MarR family transcriptional regulator [Antarcticibacterium sp. 1MA-6-2]